MLQSATECTFITYYERLFCVSKIQGSEVDILNVFPASSLHVVLVVQSLQQVSYDMSNLKCITYSTSVFHLKMSLISKYLRYPSFVRLQPKNVIFFYISVTKCSVLFLTNYSKLHTSNYKSLVIQ